MRAVSPCARSDCKRASLAPMVLGAASSTTAPWNVAIWLAASRTRELQSVGAAPSQLSGVWAVSRWQPAHLSRSDFFDLTRFLYPAVVADSNAKCSPSDGRPIHVR